MSDTINYNLKKLLLSKITKIQMSPPYPQSSSPNDYFQMSERINIKIFPFYSSFLNSYSKNYKQSSQFNEWSTEFIATFTRQTMQLVLQTIVWKSPDSEQTCKLSICHNLNHIDNFGCKQTETDVPFCIAHYM